MPSRLPDVPDLHCDGCGGYRFIPLTFPRSLATRGEKLPTRPSAKCVNCGLTYVELLGSKRTLGSATTRVPLARADAV
jgi:hypothetical protein